MPSNYDKELYQNVGKIMGIVEGMDKRLNRIEKKQDELIKKTTRNSVVCAGVFSVATNLVINQVKAHLGIPLG
jgi:hypothetical protein|nr:MAG TPA: replication protein [Caudoviricetes sp.]